MKYRREIDGLRALAVIPVILFHAGFASFSGGFVGVDVFFVISGYLITTIIVTELAAGRFTLLEFYERRARRILPALFLVMAISVPLAWVWLLPSDMKDFSESLAAVSIFTSNILFWYESGYFDAAADSKPLLHTWSLAVEEQFYVLFPLFLMFAWHYGRSRVVIIVAAVALLSLVGAQVAADIAPSANFFLLPTRAWELALGALAAFHLAQRPNANSVKFASHAASTVGIFLILYSVFAFDAKTPFPSVHALLPTVGTLLIILFATPQTLSGKLLGSQAFVGIGLISYSAYLWHQPLFAFARHRSLREPDIQIFGLLVVLVLLLSYLSWRFIEKPFRNSLVIKRRSVFAFAVVGSTLFFAFGAYGWHTNGFERRLVLPQTLVDSFKRTSRSDECFDKPVVHSRSDWLCGIGKRDGNATFLVVGDSHSLSLLEMFDKVGAQEQMSGAFTGASGCPPLLDVHALRKDQVERNCFELNRRVLELVREGKIRKVFLVGRWTYYTDGGYEGNHISYLGFTATDAPVLENSRRAFEYGVARTMSSYRDLGVDFYFVEQAPEQKYDPRKIYQRAYLNQAIDTEVIAKFSVSRIEHEKLQSFVSRVFERHIPESNILTIVDTFCNSDICPVGNRDRSYYFDDDHLSVHGADLLAERVRSILVK